MHSFQDAFQHFSFVQAKREGLVTEAIHVMFYIDLHSGSETIRVSP